VQLGCLCMQPILHVLQRPPHAHLHTGLTPQQQPLGYPLQVHLTHQSAVTRHGQHYCNAGQNNFAFHEL
jgi:hypothetical protein